MNDFPLSNSFATDYTMTGSASKGTPRLQFPENSAKSVALIATAPNAQKGDKMGQGTCQTV